MQNAIWEQHDRNLDIHLMVIWVKTKIDLLR